MLSTSLVCICRAVLNAVNRKLYIPSNINNKIMLRQQSFKWVRNSAPAIKWQNCPAYAGRSPSAQKTMHPVRIPCLVVIFASFFVCGKEDLCYEGSEQIIKGVPWPSDSFWIDLISFITFRHPLIHKQQTGQAFFVRSTVHSTGSKPFLPSVLSTCYL